MTSCICLATPNSSCRFRAMRIERHAHGPDDVLINVTHCGVCHTDLHFAKNDFFMTKFPCVPGHEVAGVVAAVGASVSKFKVGDHVGVGCFVDACLECKYCKRGDDHFCAKGETLTYAGEPKHGRCGSEITKGGYSTKMVVHERFVVRVPQSLPLDKVGPLLCAGITTFAPLKRFGVGAGSRVGVNGLGGLGTMAVKQAKAMGAHVTVISRSRRKEGYAKSIGADTLVVSSDRTSLMDSARSLDLVIDTVAQRHDIGINVITGGALDPSNARTGTLLDLLDIDGTWCFVGVSMTMIDMQPGKLLMHQHRITGSKIGGIAMQQECVEFCARHGVLPETELVPATPAALSRVYTELDRGNDSGVRFVLDIGKTLTEELISAPPPPPPSLGGRSETVVQIALLLNRIVLSKVEGFVLAHSQAVAGALCAGAVMGAVGIALRFIA